MISEQLEEISYLPLDLPEDPLKKLQILMQSKQKLEKEMEEIYNFLTVENNFGMEGGLIDGNGFPINDVGKILSVRSSRHKLAMMRNDYKKIMKMIEEGLYSFHNQPKSQIENQLSSEQKSNNTNNKTVENKKIVEEELPNRPISLIDQIFYGSPAESCGLQVGDKILKLGEVSCLNFKTLTDIAKVIQNNQNKEVPVVVIRDTAVLKLVLVPRKWDGVGLLGCHLAPL
eukprot:TRINITY_DN1373_c0_g1_i1.p1 TRINITY_DN1373_c0_g1~~TRINITY_DN1373_c0_g1_i1.p1  ORF type:complete len:229 (+),score=68.64 TRINITY_DN1373_c0_g1_i1:128-814(+)